MGQIKGIFEELSVEQLRELIHYLDGTKQNLKKADLVSYLLGIYRQDVLEPLYLAMPKVCQQWLQEAVYNPLGSVNESVCLAKYGDVPRQHRSVRLSEVFTPFLFSLKSRYREHVPAPLIPLLKCFVPSPVPAQLNLVNAPWAADVQIAERELAAQTELSLMMGLIQAGKVKVSTKTHLPSTAQLAALSRQLPEFYDSDENADVSGCDSILAFGWCGLFARCGKTVNTGTLRFGTAAGVWQQPTADIIDFLWHAWSEQVEFDEFSRIDLIKGQRKAGVLTPVVPRRKALKQALTHCPVGQWVDFDEFSRFMLASDMVFDVTDNVYELYIEEKGYGHLGFNYCHWSLLQERFMRCVLMEYAATLGLVDIAYISPVGALSDFCETWGGEGLNCLSRYDGLVGFRLTPLGAYVLGLTDDYEADSDATPLTISAGNILKFTLRPSASEALILESIASCISETEWQLDEVKLMKWVESGQDIEYVTEFIQERDSQPWLPELTQSLLTRSDKYGKAAIVTGLMHSIVVNDPDIAKVIAEHPKLPKWVAVSEGYRFMIPEQNLSKFHKWMNNNGFGLKFL